MEDALRLRFPLTDGRRVIRMHGFAIGDRVVVLPRYADLYPKDGGVVIEVKLDPFRSAFNEYKIEFADGSTADVFEFQIGKASSGT